MGELSPEHNTYLSALLDDVTGTEEIVKMRQDYCNIIDCLTSINPWGTNRHYTGSRAEGLDLAGSDDDAMYDINNMLDIEVSESAQDLVRSTSRNKLLIVTDNVPPAFAMLKCVPFQVYPRTGRLTENVGNDEYLSSQQWMSLSPFLKSKKAKNSKIQGPSVEIWTEYDYTSESGADHVLSIIYKSWPTSAAEWKDRPRRYGWPSQQDKEYIEQFGCHLVPVGHPLSAKKSLEWRFSFSVAERTLVWSFNHTQLQCYAIMKLILKEYVKTKCAEKYKSVLCSYFIKTFLFWQFETRDLSFWQITNLTGCIMSLIREFYICIQTGVLRHYFVPRFNLFKIKLTPDAKTHLLQIFGNVIQTGIAAIGQCHSLSGVFSNFIAIRDRRHCEMRTNGICKRGILDNDKHTVILLTRTMIHLHECETKSLSLSCYSFAALTRLSRGRYSTSLAIFAIRCVCLITIIRDLFNTSYQNNKYLHFFMISLGRNIYGTDIATSKLWLATFWLQRGCYNTSLQNINDILSSIPPYAIYFSGQYIKSGDDSKQLYVDRYCGRNTDILCRAKESWLFDMHIKNSEYSFVPRAIQIQLDYCDPIAGVRISPFAYAYYVMFLCYHGLGRYVDRDRALRQLIDIVSDRERCGVFRYYSYNIAGHCLLMLGFTEMARDMFLKSAQYSRSLQAPGFDKYNAAYIYLSLM